MANRDPDLVVFGAGLMRTGTMSLQTALETILEGPCYHMTTVARNTQHIAVWEKAATDGLSDDEWRKLFTGYKAAVDLPTAAFFEELSEMFPDAKVILSVREPHGWYRSIHNTVLKFLKITRSFPVNIIFYLTPFRHIHRMHDKMFMHLNGGEEIPFHNEEATVEFFERHVERVKNTIPTDRLLVFEAGDGWEPLCKFLDLPIPDAPYPHSNSTGDFMGNARRILGKELLKHFAWLTLLGVVVYQAYRRRDQLIEIAHWTINRF